MFSLVLIFLFYMMCLTHVIYYSDDSYYFDDVSWYFYPFVYIFWFFTKLFDSAVYSK